MLATRRGGAVVRAAVRGAGCRGLGTKHPVQGLDTQNEPHLPRWRDSAAWGITVTDPQAQFGAFAGSYDAHRPGYPASLFSLITDLLAQRAAPETTPQTPVNTAGTLASSQLGVDILDVATGTGRVALALASADPSARVIAADSDPKMLAAAADAATGLNLDATMQFLECPSERLSVKDASVDGITAFQSFHWFSEAEALAEFSRVLRPSGLFFAAWNDRDISVPWVREFELLIEKHNPKFDHRAKQSDLWLPVLTSTNHFAPATGLELSSNQPFHFPHSVKYGAADELVELCQTFSYVENAMLSATKANFFADVQALVADAHGDNGFELPYIAKLYVLEKTQE